MGAGERRLAWARMDDLVRRRRGVDRAQLRAPLGRADAGGGRGGRARRGRLAAGAHVRRALARGDAARRGARPARRPPGDRVAIFLPMSPEVAIASHACAHVGAIQVPIFSGFAAPAVAQRLRASEAKVAITARVSSRRGREVPMLAILEEARREAPSVEHVVVAPWDELVADCPGELPALEVDSETPYLLTYTSGTTGVPKGVVHVQGGFLVSIAREVCYQADVHAGDVVHFATDMGWIMGPWTVVGAGALGATIVFAEGRPRLAARPPLADGRGGARHLARALADADAGAAAARRPGAGSLVAAHVRDDRRAVEPRSRIGGSSRRSAAAGCRSSTAPAAPRSARASSRRCRRCRSRRARSAGRRSGWRWTSSTTRALARRHGRGRRARLPQAVPRHDPRLLARPRALPRDVLAAVPRRVGARRLGLGRRGRLLVPARALRRHAQHRGQADRARPSSSRRRSRIPRCARRRRSASRTR